MIVINARNVNDALPEAIQILDQIGHRRTSRNGDVTMFPVPVTTMYTSPCERVLWNAERDANPFFHFFESLWMLSGRRDVRWISSFAKQIVQYSDDGEVFNGAYGHRWRSHFGGRDQLDTIVGSLSKNPDDRRCVLQMWDGLSDLGKSSKDVPCNTAAYISVGVDKRLHMTVTNRSNDLIWGCYGANAVHFSMLQEYLASRIGIETGIYWQMSNNLHMYDFNAGQLRTVVDESQQDGAEEPYKTGLVTQYPLFDAGVDPDLWDQDLLMFMEDPSCFGYRHTFFSRVAKPMWFAFQAFKRKEDPNRFFIAQDVMKQCVATDWKLACQQWLVRRERANLLKKVAA